MDVTGAALRLHITALHVLPTGTPLPSRVWAARHRVIVSIVWLHALGIAIFGLVWSATPLHVLGEAAILATFAGLASARRLSRDGRATAYVCENFACRMPAADAAELDRQLEDAGAARRIII